jgi:hypothetical protein
MKAKEIWIDETMDALDGASRPESDPLIADKVWERIQSDEPVAVSFQPRTGWRIAAIILILISLNVFTMFYFDGKPDDSQKYVKSVAHEYFSYIDTINL